MPWPTCLIMEAYVCDGLRWPPGVDNVSNGSGVTSPMSRDSRGLRPGSGLPWRCSNMETSLVFSSASWSSSLSTSPDCSLNWRLTNSESWDFRTKVYFIGTLKESSDLVIILKVMEELPEVVTHCLAPTPLTLALMVQRMKPHVLQRKAGKWPFCNHLIE